MITVKPAPRQAAATTQDQPMLSVEDLRVTFTTADGESLKAVDGISFEVRPGETFGVIGESGSGKSTLGRAIVRLLGFRRGQTVGGFERGGQLLGRILEPSRPVRRRSAVKIHPA